MTCDLSCSSVLLTTPVTNSATAITRTQQIRLIDYFFLDEKKPARHRCEFLTVTGRIFRQTPLLILRLLPRRHRIDQRLRFRPEVLDAAIGNVAARLTIRESLLHSQVPLQHGYKLPAEADAIEDRVLRPVFARVLVEVEDSRADRIRPRGGRCILYCCFTIDLRVGPS